MDDIVLDSVQVLQFSQTAPAPHLPEQALAARAYRELPHGTSTPALRMTWVAVRLDPELCRPAVTARGGGEIGARKALQRAVDQLAARLGGAGLRATVLDAAGVTSAIGTATLPHPVAATHGRSAQPAARPDAPSRPSSPGVATTVGTAATGSRPGPGWTARTPPRWSTCSPARPRWAAASA
ncbi:type VII secretion protein EccE [Streptacidiphilus monticola]